MTAVTMHQLERRAIRCRYGTKRVAKAVLIAAVPPLMLQGQMSSLGAIRAPAGSGLYGQVPAVSAGLPA